MISAPQMAFWRGPSIVIPHAETEATLTMMYGLALLLWAFTGLLMTLATIRTGVTIGREYRRLIEPVRFWLSVLGLITCSALSLWAGVVFLQKSLEVTTRPGPTWLALVIALCPVPALLITIPGHLRRWRPRGRDLD